MPDPADRQTIYPSGVVRSAAGKVCDYREASGAYTCVESASKVAAPSSVTSSLPYPRRRGIFQSPT
jgi:hypothetical protein